MSLYIFVSCIYKKIDRLIDRLLALWCLFAIHSKTWSYYPYLTLKIHLPSRCRNNLYVFYFFWADSLVLNTIIIVTRNFVNIFEICIYLHCNYNEEKLWKLLGNATKNWLYILVMSCTDFRMNTDSIVAWMSRNSLLETGAKSEV